MHSAYSLSHSTNKLKKKKFKNKNLCYRHEAISSYCPFMGSLQQEVVFNGTTKLLCICTIYIHIPWEKKFQGTLMRVMVNKPSRGTFFFFFWRAEAVFWKGTIKKISCGNADALWNKKWQKKLWRTTHTSVMRVFSTSSYRHGIGNNHEGKTENENNGYVVFYLNIHKSAGK